MKREGNNTTTYVVTHVLLPLIYCCSSAKALHSDNIMSALKVFSSPLNPQMWEEFDSNFFTTSLLFFFKKLQVLKAFSR